MTLNQEKCVLCSQKLGNFPIQDDAGLFCCHGCQTVHAILLSKNQLENFVESPLFQQAVKSGLISNPLLLEQLANKGSFEEVERFYFEITDLWCPSCAEVIRLVLLQHKGIKECHVDYATDLASVTFSPRILAKESLFKLIDSLGYHAAPFEEEAQAVNSALYLRFIVAAFCSLNVMMFAYPLYATYFSYDPLEYGLVFAWLSFTMSLPVLLYSAAPIFKRFVNSLKVAVLGMETLVVIGVGAAFILSLYELLNDRTTVYFDSMTVVITFVLLGKILELKAKVSTKNALFRLHRSVPKRGRKKFANGTEIFVPIKEIVLGDLLVVRTGEKIVLDGKVVQGEGYCDESLMTGESLPIAKSKGESVLSGTILQHGELLIQVTAACEHSFLQRIIGMVEESSDRKTSYIRAVDPIIRYFVPSVLALATAAAVLSGSFEEAFLNALSVILISCPCAIGIAAPIAEARLMQALAAQGVLVRNRSCLTYLGKETLYVFDKTGTITEGNFDVLTGLDKLTTSQRKILKGMTSQSNHLISMAIARSLTEEKATPDSILEVIGKGLNAQYGSERYLLGSRSFMSENQIPISVEDGENTTLFFSVNNELISMLVLGDRLRSESKDVISQLSPTGTLLLSGDHFKAVRKVALACGFTSFRSGQTPLQKRNHIAELKQKGEIICMVGDGMNDAPSLSIAHVGISVATATDISVHSSDILLTTDKLSVLPKIRLLSRTARRIMNQNIFWAFFYNLVGIALALFGALSPIFATFAMMASSLIVLLNALRLKVR